MSEDVDSYSQAEIVRLLNGLSNDMRNLRGEVHALGATFVTRTELAAWQTSYDREITEIKDAAKPVKVSGWTVAAFVVSAIVGIGSLLGLAITLITVLK